MADTNDSSTQTDPVIITSVRKRPSEVKEENGFIKKNFKSVILKMLIPNVTVGAVLGKKGEDIVCAQKSTGAVAKLSKLGEFYPGTNERICLISGEIGNVIEFCSFLVEKIISATKEWPDIPNLNKQPQIKLLVSNAAAGVIIGKNGSSVQDIKDTCGVFIQLSQKVEGNAVSERCVILAGSKDQLVAAIAKIVVAISQDSAFNSLSILNYYASSVQQQQQQQQQQQLPLYPPQPPWPNVLPSDNYQDRYSIVSMPESPSISYPIEPNASFTSTFNQKISNVNYTVVKQLSISSLKGSISNKLERIEKTMEVPESIVGYILGKGGAALTELKALTMTEIRISNKGVYVPNTNNRSVTISGVAANVEYAMKVIRESIQNEKRRRLLSGGDGGN